MAKLTVLGIGNILMRDDGVGVRVMEQVRDGGKWPAYVAFIDGGAGGLGLIDVIEQADRMVVFDAADMQLSPGCWRVIVPGQVYGGDGDAPAAGRLSLHDAPFIETLRLCGRFLSAPGDVRILAIQPKVVDYGLEMTTELTAAMDELARAGAALVREMLTAAP